VGSKPDAIAITPDGNTAYVTNSDSESVTPIEIATNTPEAEITVGSKPDAIAITPDGNTAYVTNSDSESVTPIEIATNTPGAEIKVGKFPDGIAITPAPTEGFEQVPGSPFSSPPSAGVAFAPKGSLLASANQGTNSVSMFSVDESSGALTAVSGSPSSTGAGSEPRALAFGSGGLVAADAGTNRVSYFTVNEATGELTPVEEKGVWFKTDKDPVSIACEPTGSYCATANHGSGDISVFSPSKAIAAPGSPFAAGEGTSSVAYQPELSGPGKLLAAGNAIGDSISMYEVNESTNALTPAADSPVSVGKPVYAVAFNQTGSLLVAGTSEGVEMYSVNSATGELTPVMGSPFGGVASFDSVAFNPNGESVVAVNTKSNNASAFAVNQITGALTEIPGSPVAAQSEPFSVAFNPQGDLFALGSLKEDVGVFNALPVVSIKPAASVTQSSVTLKATVNVNGLDATEFSDCEFEYGETTAYGSSVPCTPASGSGSPTSVSATVEGLSPSTKYHYRVSLSFVAGGDPKARTPGEEFETLPSCGAEGFCAAIGAPDDIEGSLKDPEAVATDASGNIWVADSGHDRVLEFNAKHEYLRQVGSEGTGKYQFRGIRGIAVNEQGDVYVSDYGNDRVQEFSPTGLFMMQFGTAGTGAGQLIEPTGIAVDSSGDVWVLNTYGVPVQEFSAEGEYMSGFGSLGTGNGQFLGAVGIAISGGNLYVSEWINQRVQELSTTGDFLASFDEKGQGSGKSFLPWGIAADPVNGNLDVTEVGNDRVQEFSSAGNYIAAVGSSGSGAGQLSDPRGVTVNSKRGVLIADSGNKRIEEWTAAKTVGEPPTYATSFSAPDDIEGGLAEPDAVAIDPSGDIWVADSSHDRVLEYNAKHEYLRELGSEGTGQGQFRGIRGIAVNRKGDVYVSDYGNNRVQEFSSEGQFIMKFGTAGAGKGQFIEPTGIAIDSAEDVWVLNTYGVPVQEFSSAGEYMSGFGSVGTGNGQFFGAVGIAISGGNLYVSEWGNQRVQELSTAGAYMGSFDEKGQGSGKSSLPWGIAMDPTSGNLCVTEVGNDRVQEFSSAGSFVAAFGSSGSGAGQLSAPKGLAVNSSGTVFVADSGNKRIEEWVLSP